MLFLRRKAKMLIIIYKQHTDGNFHKQFKTKLWKSNMQTDSEYPNSLLFIKLIIVLVNVTLFLTI